MKCVPLVKLDAVDEVLKLFTDAVELMETNLELEDDDERSAASAAGQAAAASGGQSAASAGQSKLLSLAGGGSGSTATTAPNSSASSAASSDGETEARLGPLQNKAISGVAMTVDYSSPSSKTRSLGKQPAKAGGEAAPAQPSSRAGGGSTALGIGLKGSGGGNPAKSGVLGLHGAHKPSSRATVGLSALSSANSPAGSSSVSPVSPVTPEDGTASPLAAADTPEGIAGAAGGHLQAKNKLVAKISGAPQSREYPSPKLGPRSLSAMKQPGQSNTAPSTPSNSAAAGLGLSLPVADALGRERDAALLAAGSGAASPEADADDDEGAGSDTEAGDLIRADKKNSVFNRVKSTLPVTASPKQIRSSFHLLELATSNSLLAQDQEEDLTMKAQGGSPANGAAGAAAAAGANGPHVNSTGVLSALPTGITSGGSGFTPKPAFLRRLDSPETHHGQLIAAKARLQMLLNRGLQVADKVRMDKVPEIKAALEKALAKLEASLVTTTISH